MGDRSGIQWTNATWNPMVGCTHVSAGCDNCYAAHEASTRLAHTRQYQGLAVNGQFTGEVRLLPERLEQPLRWRKPRRIFVNSMSDAFHPGVPIEYLAKMWAVMALTPHHQYQVLTKRPQRARGNLGSPVFAKLLPEAIKEQAWAMRQPPATTPALPLPNVWVGTSIENADNLRRLGALRGTPAAVRFLSLEPLLGPLPDLDLTGIHWVIIGGESGPGARRMHPIWAYDIVAACDAQGVACFVKQMGYVLAAEWGMSDRKGTHLDEMPIVLRVREYPPNPSEVPTP